MNKVIGAGDGRLLSLGLLPGERAQDEIYSCRSSGSSTARQTDSTACSAFSATAVHSENPSIIVEMHVYGRSEEMASTLNEYS